MSNRELPNADHDDSLFDWPVVTKVERDIPYAIPANITLTESKEVTRKAVEIKVVRAGQTVWSRIVQEQGLVIPRPFYEHRINRAIKTANKKARKLEVDTI